jgi:hypothetical protein
VFLENMSNKDILQASILSLYLLIEILLGHKTKYRSFILTTVVFVVFFAISITVMVGLKIKESVWKK